MTSSLSSSLSSATVRQWLGPMSSAVIDRGRRYCRDGAVIVFEAAGAYAWATVEGGYDYDVTLALAAPQSEDSLCTCPYFEGHGVCKHLVAVLCEAHARGELETGGAAGKMDWADQELRSVLGSAADVLLAPDRAAIDSRRSQAVSSWRDRLASIAVQQRQRADAPLPDGAELMYVLDLSHETGADGLAVEVAYRVPLSDGRWSVL